MSVHKFVVWLEIGDFSGDGHEMSDGFPCFSSKSRDEVRDAYFAAKEKFPRLCPSTYCRDYEDHRIPEEIVELLEEAGAPIPENHKWVSPYEMAQLLVWFCQLGDPELKMEFIESKPLWFCGTDNKGRLSDQIGYGLYY